MCIRDRAKVQAAKFLPKPKKKGGRKSYALSKPKFTDPRFVQKLVAGKFHDWPEISDLFNLYLVAPENFVAGTTKGKKAEDMALKPILKWVGEAIRKKDFATLTKLAKAVEMFAAEKSGIADLRKSALALFHFEYWHTKKRYPTPAELVAFAREQQGKEKIFDDCLDETLFRDIRAMQLPVATKGANKTKKSG